jgi:hypothetical protein
MMSVRNSGALRRLALRLREAPRKIQQQAAAEIRADTLALIDAGFDARSDPYGTAWPPPRDGHSPPMERTGDLRRGFRCRVVPGGAGLSIEISNVEDYARWLQRGTPDMVARLTVPTSGGGLPARWRQRYEAAYRAAVERWYATAQLQ